MTLVANSATRPLLLDRNSCNSADRADADRNRRARRNRLTLAALFRKRAAATHDSDGRSARCSAARMRHLPGRRPNPPPLANRASHAVDADDVGLVAMALEYRTRCVRFVESCSPVCPRGAGAPPLDVVLRFHSAIYFQTTRAVVGHALAESGMPARRDDAVACAAQARIYVRRSRLALLRLPDGDERRSLVALLDRLSRRLDQCFPAAAGARRSTIEGPIPKY